MRTIRCGDCLDRVDAELVVDDLDPLGLADGDGAGVHPQEDAVPDDHLAGLLYDQAGGGKVGEGGGFHQEQLDVTETNLEIKENCQTVMVRCYVTKIFTALQVCQQ